MASSKFEEVRDKVREFPTQSGVYIMKNLADKIIYIGKAKNLRNRVRSYFSDSNGHSPKTRLLVQNIMEVEYILTKTEVEAFLLEASLIKKHRPKYNIRLRDDKAYPYIRFSWGDEYPRLYLARKVKKDGSLYFGPYTSGFAVHGTIKFLNRTFKIRDCNDTMFNTRQRPCMTYQIGRCTAPCVSYISQEDYKLEVEGAKLFLKGQSRKVIKAMTEKMRLAAEEEKFEVAARLRDSIEAVKSIMQKQAVINDTSEKDQDAVGFFGDERGCLIETVHVRAGRVIGTRSHYLPHFDPNDINEDSREWLVDFLNQYYVDNFIPDEVLLPLDIGQDLSKLMGEVLHERSGNKVTVRFATDERGRNLVDMANENAKSHFVKYVSKSEEKRRGLEEIKERFGLADIPRRIECYDISTFQGAETVASQVVFEDGVPAKEHYRRYKIKTVTGIDDFASMYEVLSRRFKHTEYEDPQLVVIDGGKGQLSQAMKILKEIGRQDIPVVGLAKARTESDFQKAIVESTEERFFLPGRANPVIFKHNAEALYILSGIRDEAHRFAITYHRKLRENTSLESELDYVIGLGEKRKKTLLTHFKSVDEIKMAAPEEIAQLKGFNRVLAERILLQMNESDEDETVAEES
ncbi:excinuclease ABC subunit C [Bdellovibrio bacteriovorus]|uniref:UvrABC system protein C n=1 Tax=Bdellovibrio bacteriovorus TaxID=959 RepID=A0A150WI53_BDEBC|nr:excinuclease ABC subunit UvrC [Bdellovibrio bacteriovorus]KYG63169.1 excinuclease ABC subunit C [Bdellovibrio bacteriovorus]